MLKSFNFVNISLKSVFTIGWTQIFPFPDLGGIFFLPNLLVLEGAIWRMMPVNFVKKTSLQGRYPHNGISHLIMAGFGQTGFGENFGAKWRAWAVEKKWWRRRTFFGGRKFPGKISELLKNADFFTRSKCGIHDVHCKNLSGRGIGKSLSGILAFPRPSPPTQKKFTSY